MLDAPLTCPLILHFYIHVYSLQLCITLKRNLTFIGTVNLCKGLRTNATLKQLHLSFCQLPPEAGLPLSEVEEAVSFLLHVSFVT